MFGIPMNVIMIAILWKVNVCYVLVFMLYALHFKSLSLRFTLCLVVKVSYLDITTKNPELFTKEAPAGLWTQILILESLTSKKRHKRNRVSWATRIPRRLVFLSWQIIPRTLFTHFDPKYSFWNPYFSRNLCSAYALVMVSVSVMSNTSIIV